MQDEAVEDAGDADRDAGAHEDGRHAGEHRAVDRRQDRQLDLLEVVDADGPVVPLTREEDLDEVRDDAELDELAGGPRARVHGNRAVGSVLGLSALDEVLLEDAPRHLRERERGDRAAHVTARVAVLEPARQDHVERRSRHDSELAEARNGIRERPVRDARAHAALDDLR